MLLLSEMQIREFVGSKKGMCIIVSLILLLHFLFVVSSGWNLSIPVDSERNIYYGYKFFSQGMHSYGNPAFGQGHLFGLAPIILGVDLDKTPFFGYFKSGNNKGLLAFHNVLDKNEMNAEFYEEAKKAEKEDTIRNVLRLSFVIEALISVITALVVFLWAKQIFGLKSGYAALLLYSFSPFGTSLVHGLHADNLTRLMVTLTFFYFWKFLMHPNKKNMLFTGIFLGVAMAVKVTTVYYPFIILIILIFALFNNDSFKERLIRLFKTKWTNKYLNVLIAYFLIGIVALFVLNGLFLFKDIFKPISEYDHETYKLQSDFFLSLEDSFIGKIPFPISSYYIAGLDGGRTVSTETGYLFFLGELFVGNAPKTFYLVSFLVKTTLPALILFFIIHLLFILLSFSENNEKIKQTKFTYTYFLFIFYFIFLFTTFITGIAAGLRHLGILYPLIFVLMSSIFTIRFPFSKYIKIFVWILVGWHIIAYLIAYPFFIPYFNEIIGNNNGYLYFRDTNIDYHEMYYHVIDYKREHPEVMLFPNCLIEKGKVTMSPNDLNFQRANCYGWLKNFEPIDFIGNSWPVYEVDGKWMKDENEQLRFIPSSNMQPRKAKINPFLKLFI